ncbi:GNAT family N-acetyltransferase [Aspergillus fijiensis CBS 313.89]|uniref:N-acetyltransferase domain-containing protein n=1 Tax=Aspergillus fijiensis CBS 313.89 TaxID=1448319 RepID=A0A8G1RMN9_9EURO|nr:uncharacterized protein BO72DRAFT_409280 [Aspergillus fijiensis CBS 313.89]RAK74978.1 hypothetical protein BO72DRAFT_409280 [Aspergillus fijiensis CBS 313.89]
MTSLPAYEYTFFRIPKDDTLRASAQKYQQLRLRALCVAPASFSSTYEIEAVIPEDGWVSRLALNGKETFICAATPCTGNRDPASTQEGGDQSIWVGQLTLRALRPEEFILPEESGQKRPTLLTAEPGQEGEELWQMLSLFTLPDYRGCGLGKRLCQEALKYLASYRSSPSKVWVRLMVKPENQATVGLYRGLGFGVSGKCTLAEALVANGDAELLPADVSGEKYSSRSGLIMMSEFSR